MATRRAASFHPCRRRSVLIHELDQYMLGLVIKLTAVGVRAPSTWRAYSTTAICIPRQPKKGTSFSAPSGSHRSCLPPRSPKPPRTRTRRVSEALSHLVRIDGLRVDELQVHLCTIRDAAVGQGLVERLVRVREVDVLTDDACWPSSWPCPCDRRGSIRIQPRSRSRCRASRGCDRRGPPRAAGQLVDVSNISDKR